MLSLCEGDGLWPVLRPPGWGVPLGKLLSGLLGLEDDEEETDVRGNVVRPTCGTSFEDFVENSRFRMR